MVEADDLLFNALVASKDPSSHFRFREEREWAEIYQPTQTKGGIDFDKLGQSLAGLPLHVRLQLEGDLFGNTTRLEGQIDDDDDDESDTESDEKSLTLEHKDNGNVDKQAAKDTVEQAPPIQVTVAPTLPQPPVNRSAAEQSEDDLLEELLNMPNE